ncbi:dihydropteroate synthase, partial [Acinetobacter baumannii]|uniref:dihydropteroate synthase n=1 Tax=Acinetobacter baumannii TaxID=470 RepID=UPI001BB1D661
EDSFFDESRRLDPAGAVTAAIEMLRVGSDVVDVGPAASHPDARPVSPADEIRRIAPLLDALSDQMHRVSIDSFQPETQRYALKRGVGYLNDIQGFPDPALYPDIAEADCRLVVMHSAQRDGIATRTGHLRPEDALDEIVRFFEAAGAVTAAIEMLRVGSDVVDVGPAASHPDARPVSPADEIRRIAPLLDALSDQMHRVSIDSFQPETQRYALKRGVGYLNDIQGFPDPALYPDIAEADCRLVVMHSAQRDGIATRTGHLRPEDALDEIVRF